MKNKGANLKNSTVFTRMWQDRNSYVNEPVNWPGIFGKKFGNL